MDSPVKSTKLERQDVCLSRQSIQAKFDDGPVVIMHQVDERAIAQGVGGIAAEQFAGRAVDNLHPPVLDHENQVQRHFHHVAVAMLAFHQRGDGSGPVGDVAGVDQYGLVGRPRTFVRRDPGDGDLDFHYPA